MTLGGSCLCGTVRYELTEAAVWAHACHCSRCRKTSGSAYAPNLFVPLAALRWVQGEAELKRFRPADAERFTHVFCSRCGSTLPFENPDRGLAGVPMGTLDVDPGCGLRAHIFVGSKAPWDTIADDLPQHVEKLGAAK